MSYNLSEELIVEIFTRLPPKPLLRFRSVSKSLCSCIDSPDFIRKHTCRSPQRLIMTHLVHNKHEEEYGVGFFCTLHPKGQLPLSPKRGYIGITAIKFPRKDVYIVGSCDGILLLFEYKNGIITLWNPSIMRQLTLPDCPRKCTYGIGLGIGFDPITDDNKIVSIPEYGNGESSFVYTTKTCIWCPIASPMPLYSKVLSNSCYLNGVLHWVVERCFTDSKEVELRYIMTFDLSTHVFDMIDLPRHIWETYQLATIKGSIAMISRVYGDTWIWVRGDASWCVVLKSETIKVEAGIKKVLELTNNGDLLLDGVLEGLHVYTPKTEALSPLVNFNHTSSLLDVNMYVETLQLLHTGTACEV